MANLVLKFINFLLIISDQHLALLDSPLQILSLLLKLDFVILFLERFLLDHLQLIQKDLPFPGKLFSQLPDLISFFVHRDLKLSLQTLILLVLVLEFALNVVVPCQIFVELLDFLLFHHDGVDCRRLYLLNVGHELLVFMGECHQIILGGAIGGVGQSSIQLDDLFATIKKLLLFDIEFLQQSLPLREL